MKYCRLTKEKIEGLLYRKETINMRDKKTLWLSKGDICQKLTKIEQNQLDQIFSRQEIRYDNNDFTVSYKRKWFQLAENTLPSLVIVLTEVNLTNPMLKLFFYVFKKANSIFCV